MPVLYLPRFSSSMSSALGLRDVAGMRKRFLGAPISRLAVLDARSSASASEAKYTRMNTYEKRSTNSCRMCTYKMASQPLWNEHLQKHPGRGSRLLLR